MTNQKKVWDAISEKWAEFRIKPVNEVMEFLENKTGNILDLGCGSGRNFMEKSNLKFYGVDFSEKLLDFAKEKRYIELKKSDVIKIPYSDSFFDYVIFVRVLHCVKGAEKRKKTLEEIYRVLKDKGEVLVSVWGKQRRVKNKGKEFYLPWTVDGAKHLRYTYIFDKKELEDLVKEVGFGIVKSWEDNNIYLILRKS